MSVLENAKERPRAWSSVVFMAPWSTLGRLLTQAPLLTRPNLSKEAPWVGQRRPNRTPRGGNLADRRLLVPAILSYRTSFLTKHYQGTLLL